MLLMVAWPRGRKSVLKLSINCWINKLFAKCDSFLTLLHYVTIWLISRNVWHGCSIYSFIHSQILHKWTTSTSMESLANANTAHWRPHQLAIGTLLTTKYYLMHYLRELFVSMILSGCPDKDIDGYVDLNSPSGRDYLMQHLRLCMSYYTPQNSCLGMLRRN